MGIKIGAAFWGFAEATLFFIVPDVYLSAVGLRDLRKALWACLYALAGALVGGFVMYHWGASDNAGALEVLHRIPAISDKMSLWVKTDLAEKGVWAVFLGPLFGVPYKLFAAQAASSGLGLIPFLLISVPARLIRFVVVTLLVRFLVDRLVKSPSLSRKLIVHVAGWSCFYLFYFLTHLD